MTLHKQIFAVVLLALFLRVLNFSFPAFTGEEASIAFRGHTLSMGVDELGRSFPYLFNSQYDYRLPLTSYVSALGAIFFGKSELAARIPFIIIGLVLVLLTYKVSTQLSAKKSFHIFSTFIVATSPVLIFASKVPNESIIATTLLLLLFYLLNKDRLNLVLIFLTIIFLISTSKFAWFILAPFVIYTVFIYRNTLNLRDKLKLSLISLTFAILAFAFFLQIPQGTRSLSENNLSLFSDITITNGINRIRGQGRESGWPPILGKMLVNKSHFFAAGSLHWLSNMQPAVFFSQFDENANLSFAGMGAFPKITIIPAIIGILFLIRIKSSKFLLYPFLIALPSALVYPQFSPEIVILTLPFVAYIIAFGFLRINRIFRGLILTLMMLELFINFLFLFPQVKLTNDFRPEWIKPIVREAFNLSDTAQVFISDDITWDITSFIEWYTPFNPEDAFLDIPYPYKFRQTNLGKIKLVGASDSFRSCGLGENSKFFSSKRDLDRAKDLNSIQATSTYLNSRKEVAVYFIEKGVCIN
ncbi:glycosyltransferase family 39 protein [Patescibacteria group bacterium]|nr:glycosyltransferase family 39 protein [Patescibacteria group bacterium]